MSDQIPFPFYLDEARLAEFLTTWFSIEDEHDRLREQQRLLKEQYQEEFPMRAALTAIKVIRARKKLAEHAKEPMPYVQQGLLEALVETHLAKLDAEREAVQNAAARLVPDMTRETP